MVRSSPEQRMGERGGEENKGKVESVTLVKMLKGECHAGNSAGEFSERGRAYNASTWYCQR